MSAPLVLVLVLVVVLMLVLMLVLVLVGTTVQSWRKQMRPLTSSSTIIISSSSSSSSRQWMQTVPLSAAVPEAGAWSRDVT